MPSFETSVKAAMSFGTVGSRANAENFNTITRLASETETAKIGFGQPVERGASTNTIRSFATGDCLGITEVDHFLEEPNYTEGAPVPVLTHGVIFVGAIGTCTQGTPAKWDKTTGLFSDAGTITIPHAEFDSEAFSGVVKIRLTRVAGQAV